MQVKSARRPRAVLGQLSDMDLRLLQVFKAVVECGGMAAAELELNIGTSTVSRHVKDLETRLGLTLCRRGRAGFALTPEGQRVYEETLRLLASVRGFLGSIDDIHDRMGGQLAVAVFDKTASNPAARIGDAIATFTASSPPPAARRAWSIQTCSARPCCCIAARATRCSAHPTTIWTGTPCAATRSRGWATTRPTWS